MDDAVFLRALAAGTPSDIVHLFKDALADHTPRVLTPKLLAAVDEGSIPPAVFGIYLANAQDLDALSAALQSRSSSVRCCAIKYAGKLLRSEKSFAKTWTALGGAPGIAGLMRSLSVDDVDRVCRTLGKIPGLGGSKFSPAALLERQQSMSQLLDLVCVLKPFETPSSDRSASTRDPRPLDHLYARLVPACTEQTRDQWWIKENPGREKPKASDWYPDWLKPGQGERFHADIDLNNQVYTLDGISWLLNHWHDKGHSESIIQSIAKADFHDLEIEPSLFFQSNILSLAASLPRRKLPPGAKARAWDLIASCFQRWPQMADQLNFSYTGKKLIQLAIRRWDYAVTEESHVRAGKILCELLKLTPNTQNSCMKDWFQSGFFKVKLQHEHQLLLWLFGMTKRYGVDIKNPAEQDRERLKGLEDRFPMELFQDEFMPGGQALDFLTLLAQIRPDKTFLQPHYRWSIFSIPQGPTSDLACGDFVALECHLFNNLSSDDPRRAGVNMNANLAESMKLRMDKATKSREWNDRFFWARSALYLAVASGSLDLYSQTLTWTRRFDKDWQTLKELYRSDVLLTKEGIGLLSGIPSRSQLTTTPLTAVTNALSAAGKVVSQILDTAAANIREPTFSSYNWGEVKSLLREIVMYRFRRADAFQEHNGLSNDEVYAVVWQPTVTMLLSAETFALKEEHQELLFADRRGFIHGLDFADSDLRGHAWRFLDNLAKARDELWRKERSRRFPSVITLPAPWPKGLPVEDLCANHFGKAALKLPYAVSRAEAVLFASPEQLLSPVPSDLEFRKATGGFCDSYKACFQIYASGCPEAGGLGRDQRVARVWRYATTELTGSRMDKEEARSFWQDRVFGPLTDYLPNPPEPLPQKPLGPVFPRTVNPSEPTEWHPDSVARKKDSSRKLEGPIRCLDCIVGGQARGSASMPFGASENPPPINKLTVDTHSRPSFWDLHQYSRPFSGENQDAFIATALLSLNNEAGTGVLLMKPFPTPSIARFPAVYLSDEFLEEMTSASQRIAYLQPFQRSIPPALLLRLAAALSGRLRDRDDITWQERETAFGVIKLVARSDMPWMARDLIRDIVLDRQELSSWHRHLLSNGFFSRLTADEAREFLDGIANAMVQRLKEPKPAIKVSTVKMLAQILQGSKFVGHDTICSILGQILENARHIDIRIAVIQSLVELFLSSQRGGGAVELETEIFDILKVHAVPLAASLDERRGIMTEEMWVAAEADGVIPEVGSEGEVELILRAPLDSQLMPEWQDRWAREIIGAAMVESSKNYARWEALFLKVNNLSVPEGEGMPAAAASRGLQVKFLETAPQYMDRAYLEHLVQLTMVNLEPGPGLAAINSKIREQPGLKNSSNGRLWLERYGNSGSAALELAAVHAGKLLCRSGDFTFPLDGDVGVRLVQNFLFDVAEIFIQRSDLVGLDHLLRNLDYQPQSPPLVTSEVAWHEAWKANTVPLLERIIARIDSLRTPEWQRNPKRHPHRLAHTFGMRVRLLPSRWPRTEDKPRSDEDIAGFAGAVQGLITELANRGTPFKLDWEGLCGAISRASVEPSEFLRIALALAEDVTATLEEGERQPTLSECLCVELAASLINRAHDPKDHNVARRAWDMLTKQWARSHVEFLRDQARTEVEQLRRRGQHIGSAQAFWKDVERESRARDKEARRAARKQATVDGDQVMGGVDGVEEESDGDEEDADSEVVPPGETPMGEWAAW